MAEILQKCRKILIGCVFIVCTLLASTVNALEVRDYGPNIPLPDVYITAFSVDAAGLRYVELYNNTSSAVDLRGWRVCATTASAGDQDDCDTARTTFIDRWLASKDFGLLAVGYEDDGSFVLPMASPSAPMSPDYVSRVMLRSADDKVVAMVELTAADSNLAFVRKGLTSTYGDNKAATVFSTYDPTKTNNGLTATHFHVAAPAFSGGWYVPPAYNAGIRIVEIVANPRSCSPTEAALDCADYVKLFVGDLSHAEIAQYALRTDSGGVKRTSTNGQDLADFPITEEGYITVPLAVTNSGGYVWIEDLLGTMRYEQSVVFYPDMSLATKRGYAWAIDSTGVWQWTSTPQPDAANHLYLPPEPVKVTTQAAPTSCREGQERNPATNRCRSIVAAIAELVPCREGQERNPATNRCRAVAAASTLAPCQEGQERNPETNRCRKIVLASSDIPAIKDVESRTEASMTGWWIAGGVIILAAGYAVYEWRDELRQRFPRTKK